jgi:TatD DNase family protein
LDPLFYDSHIHLVDEYYANFLTQILTSMRELRIKGCSVTIDVSTSRRAIDMFSEANRDVVFNFVGIHPEFAQTEEFSEFEDLVAQNRNFIDGIGEIGLDHSYDTSNDYNYSKQVDIFQKMLNLAEEIEKPVSIHSRGTLDEILNLIPSYDNLDACLHWFDGTEKQLQRSMDMGLYEKTS